MCDESPREGWRCRHVVIARVIAIGLATPKPRRAWSWREKLYVVARLYSTNFRRLDSCGRVGAEWGVNPEFRGRLPRPDGWYAGLPTVSSR
jgi:hypothetical protein